jgi:SAM-dependent methyltransferase
VRYFQTVENHQNPRPDARPEWELILACARTRLDDLQRSRIHKLIKRPLDWTDVVSTAARHGVDPLLYRHLRNEVSKCVTPDTLQTLLETVRLRMNWSFQEVTQLIALVEMFASAGVPAVPYRGPTLAIWVYGSLGLRVSADLDFVLKQKDIAQAFALLIAAGYRPEIDPAVPRDARFIASGTTGQYRFRGAGGSAAVELHSEKTLRYFPLSLDLDALCQRLRSVSIAGREVRTFSAEDTLVMLCVHGAKHFWDRLKWLCDIAELAQMPDVDWELAERRARQMDCRRMWLLGLSLAGELLDAPLPGPVSQLIRADPTVDKLGQRVKTYLFPRQRMLPSAPRRFFFRLRSHESLVQGLRQCAQVAMRPTEEDWRSHRLPNWAAPLYAALRPWRLLRHHGLGWRGRALPDLSPFVASQPEIAAKMLRFAEVRSGDVLYDLGCGDGQIVITAAKRFGIRAVGIDIDSRRIAEARVNSRKNGVEHLVEFVQQDARSVDLSSATVVALFLEVPGVLALREKLRTELRPGTRIVSQEFLIPGWPPDASEEFVADETGRMKYLFLWRTPQAVQSAISAGVGGR